MSDVESTAEEPSKGKRRRRTPDTGIDFSDGNAAGWTFGVPTAFRDALDIKYLSYVEKASDSNKKSVRREAWTRAIPPARSFSEGHVFYDPPRCRDLGWDKALKIVRRIAQVHAAAPDQEDGTFGWVEFELSTYEQGKLKTTDKHRVAQGDFEEFLRTGSLKS